MLIDESSLHMRLKVGSRISVLVSESRNREALRIFVSGIVQGVGFRPHTYKLASRAGVAGYVRNLGGSGVEIHVEGDPKRVRLFLESLKANPPPGARIDEITVSEAEPQGFGEFSILPGEGSLRYNSMIPPDIGICRDCLAEVLGETRWSGYPFNSCVYCGPRYSMIIRVPYERENTSMRDFPLCEQCFAEYSDPQVERRFHAQGISCPACGPKVWLADVEGRVIREGPESITLASRLIDEGYIVAVKGVGGFHIACSATLDQPIARLRERKRRPTKPFAIMVLDARVLSELVEAPEWAVRLLEASSRPIMLLKVKSGARVSPLVAPSLRKLGVLLPYTALHFLLLEKTNDKYAIMTSGNPHGEPMCIDNEEALERLGGIVDYFLLHNRRIVNRVDDSVLRITRGAPVMLRRGRGFAPMWVSLPFRAQRCVVAFGAMLQSAGAVAFEDKVVLTPFVGDVDEYNTFRDLEGSIRKLMETYSITPREAILASDLHPLYPSSRLADEWSRVYGSGHLRIQHHWAHVAAVMAEHGVLEDVIGVAIDGVGLGLDGRVWGGEVLTASLDRFVRVGHLKPQRMPSGDGAAHHPARMLVGILSDGLSREELIQVLKELRIVEKGFRGGLREVELLISLAEKGAPLTSSAGRVLDAVSAMLGLCFFRSYEGEPAIVLEEHSTPTNERIRVRIEGENPAILDTTDIVLQALEHLRAGTPRGEVAYMVQQAIGYGLGLIARRAAGGRKYIVISGGAAVNEYILEGVEEALDGSGLRLLTAREIPPNDGGIALGQAAIAAWRGMNL
jgi:hydrogenase maturation protein HypF